MAGNSSFFRSIRGTRRAQDAWHDRHEQLLFERAGIRSALIADIAIELRNHAEFGTSMRRPSQQRSAAASKVESLQALVNQAMYSGYDSFAAAGRDLAEQLPFLEANGYLIPTLKRYIDWLSKADARLGEYPR